MSDEIRPKVSGDRYVAFQRGIKVDREGNVTVDERIMETRDDHRSP